MKMKSSLEKEIYIARWVELGRATFLKDEEQIELMKSLIQEQEKEMLKDGFNQDEFDGFVKDALNRINGKAKQ